MIIQLTELPPERSDTHICQYCKNFVQPGMRCFTYKGDYFCEGCIHLLDLVKTQENNETHEQTAQEKPQVSSLSRVGTNLLEELPLERSGPHICQSCKNFVQPGMRCFTYKGDYFCEGCSQLIPAKLVPPRVADSQPTTSASHEKVNAELPLNRSETYVCTMCSSAITPSMRCFQRGKAYFCAECNLKTRRGRGEMMKEVRQHELDVARIAKTKAEIQQWGILAPFAVVGVFLGIFGAVALWISLSAASDGYNVDKLAGYVRIYLGLISLGLLGAGFLFRPFSSK